jgi:hypothetical protein
MVGRKGICPQRRFLLKGKVEHGLGTQSELAQLVTRLSFGSEKRRQVNFRRIISMCDVYVCIVHNIIGEHVNIEINKDIAQG